MPGRPRRRTARWDPGVVARGAADPRRARPAVGAARRAVARGARRRRPDRLRPRGGDRRLPARRPSRSRAPRAPRRRAAVAEGATDRPSPTSAPAPGPRTPPGWSAWRAGSSRTSRWDDLVLPPVVRRAAPRAHRAGPPPRPRRSASGGWAPAASQGRGRDGAVRGRLGHRQDDVRRGGRRRPRARPLRHRPLDRRRQVHRRDREEPRPHLHRGRPGERRAAVRRGRRALRQALRGQATPATATRTSRSPTSSSGWSSSTASRS